MKLKGCSLSIIAEVIPIVTKNANFTPVELLHPFPYRLSHVLDLQCVHTIDAHFLCLLSLTVVRFKAAHICQGFLLFLPNNVPNSILRGISARSCTVAISWDSPSFGSHAVHL